jgi:hypothetical protein
MLPNMALTHSTTEQMLRELTCRPFEVDHSVIYFPKSLPIPPKLPAFRDLSRGALYILPPELLSLIFTHIDFQSLGALRCTCFGIKIEVDGFREFSSVTLHASAALRALQVTGMISYHPASKIFQALISPECSICHEYGPYLSLLTGSRCCFYCVFTHPSLALIYKHVAEAALGIPRTHTIPVITTPNLFDLSFANSQYGDINQLIGFNAAVTASLAYHGSDENMRRYLGARQRAAYDTHKFRQGRTPDSRSMPRPYGIGDLRSLQCFPPVYSFMGVTPFPRLDVKGGGKVEWGVWCSACLGNERVIYEAGYTELWYGQNRNIGEGDEDWEVRVKEEVKERMRAFTEENFWVHFKGCEKARKRWETRGRTIARISREEEGVLAVDD